MKKQVLLNRSFLLLWLAQITSSLAFNMMNIILVLFVFEQTSSNIAISGLVISFILPALFFGMLAGTYVDRRNKNGILLFTNLARAFFTALFFVASQSLPIVFVLSFLVSTATQFFIPAEASSIPRVVGKTLLVWANSLFTVTLYVSMFLGYILAGPVLKVLGFSNSFLFASSLYLFAAFSIYLLPSLGRERAINMADFFRTGSLGRAIMRIREVYQLIAKVKNIFFAIVFLTTSQGIVAVLVTLLPGYSRTVLDIESSDIPLVILTPAILGMIFASLLLVNFPKKSSQMLVNVSIIFSGIILLVLPHISLHQYSLILTVILFMLGLTNALILIISNVTLQAQTEKHLVGRVYGVVLAVSAAFALLPVLLAGGFADILGVKTVLTFIGIIIIIAGVLTTYKGYAF